MDGMNKSVFVCVRESLIVNYIEYVLEMTYNQNAMRSH